MTAYLDSAATTPLEPRVRDEVARYLEIDLGNAGSRHDFGLKARRAMEQARDREILLSWLLTLPFAALIAAGAKLLMGLQ